MHFMNLFSWLPLFYEKTAVKQNTDDTVQEIYSYLIFGKTFVCKIFVDGSVTVECASLISITCINRYSTPTIV